MEQEKTAGNPDFKNLFESAPGLFLVLSPDLKIVAVSDAYLRATGAKRDEIIDNGVFDVFPDNPNDPNATGVANLKASFERVLQNKIAEALPVQKYDIQRPKSKGGGFEVRYWRPLNSPVFGENNEVAYIIHSVEDTESILPKKQGAEELESLKEQLNESEKKISIVLDSAQVGVWDWDFVNDTTWRTLLHDQIFGYEHLLPEWGYKTFIEHVMPEDKEYVNKRVEEAHTNGKLSIECRIKRINDNAIRWVSIQGIAYKNEKKELTKIMGIITDITERKKVEDDLIKSNERFIKIFDFNPVAMTLINMDTGIIQYANENFLSSFGYKSEEIIGKTLIELNFIEPSVREKILSQIGHQSYIKELEIFLRKKNGEVIWTLTSVQIITFDDKKYFLGSYLDITNRKKAEDVLRQYSEDLAHSNKDLEQFAFVASHHLQEPLGIISSFVSLLKEKHFGKLDEDTDQYLKFISNASAKMQNLIKDLMELSRVGKNITFTAFDCNVIVKEVIAEMETAITECNAKITLSILPIIKGGKTELKQLFRDLISNALKFRKKNETPEIDISVQEKEFEYIFAVKDNGIGIESQYFDKMFIVFQRVHNDAEYPGTGIGLSTCKKIVTLHGGKIWVKSKLGEGTTIYFSMPKNMIN